jgi:dTDP-4-amino-4,6-dideoxygalactose transaminase
LGVQQGDEVICQSFTFAASANPIAYMGATPVFVDSERITWNMDPALLEEAVRDRISEGKKPAAIVYVHLYGMPAQVDEIRRIAEEYEIPLIEDAAEALGAGYKGIPAGNFGDISFFSFNGNKIITTSGGGALLSRTKKYVDDARFLATQARDPAPHYQHSRIGYNYRLSNISAGIGRGQMLVLDRHMAARRKIYERYLQVLGQHEYIAFLDEPDGHYSNRWLTCILLPDKKTRDRLMDVLSVENIESRPLWKPLHLQPVFRDVPFFGSGVSEDLFSRGLCLPSGSDLKNQVQNRIINLILNNV